MIRRSPLQADSCPENDTVTTTLNLLCASAHQDPNVPSFEYREIHPNNSARICDFEINFEAPEVSDSDTACLMIQLILIGCSVRLWDRKKLSSPFTRKLIRLSSFPALENNSDAVA